MATVLVVDDSEFDRTLAGSLLEERDGFVIRYAVDGREALEIIRREPPDLVLTDMQMPEMNGLELVETVQREYASVPIILMTAHGSAELAVAALLRGAASYVSKRNLARDLLQTVENVLKLTRRIRSQPEILEALAEVQFRYVLPNDLALVMPIVGHCQEQMIQMRLVDECGLVRVGKALFEVMVNAIEHGNLELHSALKESGDRNSYTRLSAQRQQQPPYRDRHVYVTATFTHGEAVYDVRDEGPGFDPFRLPDPTDPDNLDKVSGRGLLLVRTFMDEVTFNANGNHITMVKRRHETLVPEG